MAESHIIERKRVIEVHVGKPREGSEDEFCPECGNWILEEWRECGWCGRAI